MIIFQYDATFEGLLTALFDAYFRRTFPDLLLAEKEPLPLFYDESHRVITDMTKAERVWKLLTRKLSRSALSVKSGTTTESMQSTAHLSRLPSAALRYSSSLTARSSQSTSSPFSRKQGEICTLLFSGNPLFSFKKPFKSISQPPQCECPSASDARLPQKYVCSSQSEPAPAG